MTELLELANTHMVATHPDERPLTAADISAGAVRADGGLSVLFLRSESDAGTPIRVSIAINAAGQSAVAVIPQGGNS